MAGCPSARRAARGSDGTAESRYVFGAIGSHVSVSENLMLGAMIQLDHLDLRDGDERTRGTGWMVGPYFVARLAEHPLYFEGRLLYGETRNTISPDGTYEDRFDTERVLAQFKVAGEITRDATRFMPFLDLSYLTEDISGYQDSLGNIIPSQTASLGQIELGLDFSHRVTLASGSLDITGGLSGIWSETGGDAAVIGVMPGYEGARARAELGLHWSFDDGQSLSFSGWYDGIGTESFENYGLSVRYESRF